MRAVIQRVNSCRVEVDSVLYSETGAGMLILLGIKEGDTINDVEYLSEKIKHLRIFDDENGVMNKSVLDIRGQIMIVSQFTLYGDCRKGRRPSYIRAAKPDDAIDLYEQFVESVKKSGLTVKTGKFRAEMNVILENNGPVTLLLDSEKTI